MKSSSHLVEALQHCAGIGPVRLTALQEKGVRSWEDVLQAPEEIPAAWRTGIVDECVRCNEALDRRDINYFVQNLAAQDKWRILSEFLDDTSFFDIETAGLEQSDPITVIACWHRGQVHTFVEHENLDDFLELLDDVKLLASFNGSTFDVPRVLDAFHIPELRCPHLDLRWPCYHRGWSGGLKEIVGRLGIERPADLTDADGQLAIDLWADWEKTQNKDALSLLLRYCASDVVLLWILAHHMIGRESEIGPEVWDVLPEEAATNTKSPPKFPSAKFAQVFGKGGPSKLRALRKLTR